MIGSCKEDTVTRKDQKLLRQERKLVHGKCQRTHKIVREAGFDKKMVAILHKEFRSPSRGLWKYRGQ